MSVPKGNQQQDFDCIIIGAGISGLLAATVMSRAGLSTCVLDKGRGVGGRMATRRREGAIFDHGAQFFTARDERFSRWVEEWRSLGLVEPWYEYGSTGMHFRGAPGMTAIAKYLAADLNVRRETLVSKISYGTDPIKWTVTTSEDDHLSSRQLILTAPVPQSLALLENCGAPLASRDLAQLKAIRFSRCIAALAILDQPSALTQHGGALKLKSEPVQWIGDNFHKGVSPQMPAVTIHSTPAFAEEHWHSDDSVRLPKLLDAAAPFLQARVVSCHGHRWGFSAPLATGAPYPHEAYIDGSLGLAMAGDGLTGGRVEGAALSGLTAASELVASTKTT